MSTSLAFKDRFARIAFLAVAALFFFGPWAWPGFRNHAAGVAVVSGVIYALLFGNPFLARTSKLSGTLLGVAIVGMGGGMNLLQVLRAGADGLVLTVVGISAGLALGVALGRLFGVSRDARWLIAVGTSICGGSAIAAVTPILKAKPHDVALAVATVFILNAVALLIFPPLGHWLGLDQHVFGTWAALAIHDTSSVVGACYQYGPQALDVGTTVKLARALWIAPVALFVGWIVARGETPADGAKRPRAKVPWFIPGFLLAAAIVTYVPGTAEAGRFAKSLAQYLMVATLFLIGANLSRDKIKELGPRPFLLGVALWLLLGTGWGLAAKLGVLD